MFGPGPFKAFMIFGNKLGSVETWVKRNNEFKNHFAKLEVDSEVLGYEVGEWFLEIDGVEFGKTKDTIQKYMRNNNFLSERSILHT